MKNHEKSPTASISVLLFGMLAENVGRPRLEIDADRARDIEALLGFLRAEFAPLRTAKFAVAIDEEIRNDNAPLSAGMTVALLPPFSGG